jgi:broad specificity phosphatase PhoE
VHFDGAFSSHAERTFQTAAIILGDCSIKIKPKHMMNLVKNLWSGSKRQSNEIWEKPYWLFRMALL